jgi:hypothetical protein
MYENIKEKEDGNRFVSKFIKLGGGRLTSFKLQFAGVK